MEGDPDRNVFICSHDVFQSTPSAWRETSAKTPAALPSVISIHSLRMEGDSKLMTLQVKIFHFNPLPPHGGRLRKLQNLPIGATFQSTPSAWRETSSLSDWELKAVISIHSLRMEGDSVVSDRSTAPRHFNPLPPHGGRQEILNSIENAVRISIHSLRMEGDKQGSSCKVREERHFNPLPPHGGRLQLANTIIQVTIFQSTPSAWRETRSFPCREHGFRISIHSLRMEGDFKQ